MALSFKRLIFYFLSAFAASGKLALIVFGPVINREEILN
jgi:hypothetical protein